MIRKMIRRLGAKLLSISYSLDQTPGYRDDMTVGYACGAKALDALLDKDGSLINRVYVWDTDSENDEADKCLKRVVDAGIPVTYSKTAVPKGGPNIRDLRLSAEFRKWKDSLEAGNHVLLDRPSLSCNIASVMRSAYAFGIRDIAVINEEGLDSFAPLLIRASEGARFMVRLEVFSTLEEYLARFPSNNLYAFILDENAQRLDDVQVKQPFTIAFGNESRGLPPEYLACASGVFIEQSREVDSLNMSAAAGISIHELMTRSL